jgi:hypothetical protein
MMMMIAMMRSTPSGIVTFKDLYVSLKERIFFFYSPRPQKQSQKQRDDTVVHALIT